MKMWGLFVDIVLSALGFYTSATSENVNENPVIDEEGSLIDPWGSA